MLGELPAHHHGLAAAPGALAGRELDPALLDVGIVQRDPVVAALDAVASREVDALGGRVGLVRRDHTENHGLALLEAQRLPVAEQRGLAVLARRPDGDADIHDALPAVFAGPVVGALGRAATAASAAAAVSRTVSARVGVVMGCLLGCCEILSPKPEQGPRRVSPGSDSAAGEVDARWRGARPPGARRQGFNLWRLPLDGGKPTRLTDFDNVPLWAFEISPDGKTLFFTKGVESSDGVLIEDPLTSRVTRRLAACCRPGEISGPGIGRHRRAVDRAPVPPRNTSGYLRRIGIQ